MAKKPLTNSSAVGRIVAVAFTGLEIRIQMFVVVLKFLEMKMEHFVRLMVFLNSLMDI